MNRPEPIDAARLIIDRDYSDCCMAILSTSILHNATATSDLDIVIFDDSPEMPFRKSFSAYGWPVEVFILNRENYRFHFDAASYSGIPSLLRICADGIVLKNDGAVSDIICEAKESFEKGPWPWKPEDLFMGRYQVTEQLQDLIGCNERNEGFFIVARLTLLLSEFMLRSNCKWIGDGKWMDRCIKQFNPSIHHDLQESLEAYFTSNNKELLIAFTELQLAPHGGLLFEYDEPFPLSD
jgi:hypothetical protein